MDKHTWKNRRQKVGNIIIQYHIYFQTKLKNICQVFLLRQIWIVKYYVNFLYGFGFNLKKRSCRKSQYLQSIVEYLTKYLTIHIWRSRKAANISHFQKILKSIFLALGSTKHKHFFSDSTIASKMGEIPNKKFQKKKG